MKTVTEIQIYANPHTHAHADDSPKPLFHHHVDRLVSV
jgi:hypothetical protein